MYYDDLEGFGPNRHKTEQNAYPNSERAGAGRDDTGPPASETGQPHGKLHVTLPRVAKSSSVPLWRAGEANVAPHVGGGSGRGRVEAGPRGQGATGRRVGRGTGEVSLTAR